MTKLTIKIFGTEIEYEGSEEFLEEKVPLLLDAVRKSQNEEARRTLRDVHEELLQDLVAVEGHFASMMQLCEEAARRANALNEGVAGWAQKIEELAASGDASAALMAATREMQEMNQQFNLQYLELQQKMQSDNRQFTLLSNIMKTKHDTAKNAINNVR